ncbi:hypothetical protein PAHAL_2G265200 [Panicum hallii]|uniref:Uncharacterized protein n=1 Tax=Panicum hallii TaxID=206008 RepID=A0A2S3GZK5_9POAL|nr:hypothetical protein PAHAL_2G265200 [Panicum hallii]
MTKYCMCGQLKIWFLLVIEQMPFLVTQLHLFTTFNPPPHTHTHTHTHKVFQPRNHQAVCSLSYRLTSTNRQ